MVDNSAFWMGYPRTQVAPEDIHFTTLEGVLFVAIKNDMAFTVKNKVLVISEHQSTINKNMPLRSIIYYMHILKRMILLC